MSRRDYDPLHPGADRPHWLVISDLHRNQIDCTSVPAGANLADVMAATIARLTGEGWQAESDGAHGFVFVRATNGARRLVNLTPVDPGASNGGGHGFLAGSGAV
jgi:hypothetical protein